MTDREKTDTDSHQNSSADSNKRPLTARKPGLFKKLILLSGAIVFSAVLAEMSFRLFIPVTDAPLNVWDPVVGPRRFPNQSGVYMIGDYIRGRFHFNGQGWNHPRDYQFRKPLGTRRVCIVGDSYIDALQVDVKDAMFCVAERDMSPSSTEWYAFGVSGWGTSNEYEAIRHYALDYHPDLVVMFFTQNDPFDTSPYLRPLADSEPRFFLDESGELQSLPIGYWEPNALRRFSADFAIIRYFVLQKMIIGKLGRGGGAPGGFALREEMAGARNDFVPGLAKMDLRKRQEMTWKLYSALLSATREECVRRGSQFAVVYRGDICVIDDAIGGVARWPATPIPPMEEDPWCLETRHRRMGIEQVGPICEKLNIPYLDLTEPLRAEVSKTRLSHCFPDNDHYSKAGHEAAGHALAKWADELLSRSNEAR